MDYRPLGRSGIEVSRVILGCGNFGGIGSAPELFGQGESDEEAAAIMDRGWELGITTFDTADAYGGGRGEDSGLAPERIRRQLGSSLERLGVEHVDLYLTHAPDPETPLAETLEALDELIAEERIGAYGGANVDGAVLREASGRYAWVQNSYSLLDRADEVEVMPLVEGHGLGYTPFSPLSGGWLAGRYRRGKPA